MNRIAIVATLVLTACESQKSKLDRLETQRTVAAVYVQHWQRIVDSLRQREAGAWDVKKELAASRDSLYQAQLHLTLAQRDLDRFLK